MYIVLSILIIAIFLQIVNTQQPSIVGLRYGSSEIVLGTRSITLVPFYSGAALSFSITPQFPTLYSYFNDKTGLITFGPDVGEGTYTITATGYSSSTSSYSIKLSKGNNNNIDPPQDLKVGLQNSYVLYDQLTYNIELYIKGNPKLCTVTPALPSGLTFGINGITGTPTSPSTPKLYTFSCSNEGGVSNIVSSYISILSGSGSAGILQHIWTYGGEPDNFPCNEITTPFNTPLATLERTSQVDSLSLNNIGYTQYFGVLFDGYITLSSDGEYSFSTIAQGGAYIMIDNQIVVNDMTTCKSSDSIPSTVVGNPITLKNGKHAFKAGYHIRTGTPSVQFRVQFQQSGFTDISGFIYLPIAPLFLKSTYYIAKVGETVNLNVITISGSNPNMDIVPEGFRFLGNSLQGTAASIQPVGAYRISYTVNGEIHNTTFSYGVKAANGPTNFYLVYGGSERRSTRILNNQIYAKIGWYVDVSIFPMTVSSYIIEGTGVDCPPGTCTIVNGPNVFLASVSSSSKSITGECKSPWTSGNEFTVKFGSIVVGKFSIFCTDTSPIPSWQFLSVLINSNNCGKFDVISLYGTRVLGGKFNQQSTTGTTLTGALLSPSSYILSLESTSDCTATFNINIGYQDYVLSTSKTTPQYLKFETSALMCNSQEGLPQTNVFGIREISCPSGQTGKLKYKCIFDNNNNPSWSVISNTCSFPRFVSYFHYGVSSLRINVGTTVTLQPYSDGSLDSFTIDPVLPSTSSLDNSTGIIKLMLLSVQDYVLYTISAKSLDTIYKTTINVTYVTSNTVAPIRNIQILPSPYFGFAQNIPVIATFRFSSGNADSCQVTPTLPNGILVDRTKIYGYSNLTDPSYKTYHLSCSNSDSVSNIITFTLPVNSASSLKQGLWSSYWRYTGTASQISCNTQWEAYVSPNTEVITVRVDASITHQPSDTIWTGLNNYFNDNWGVTWHGYINIETSTTYTFSTRSIDGSWVEIDDTLVSTNYLCHDFTQASTDYPISLQRGYHKILIRYFNRIGEHGFNLLWKYNNEPLVVVPDNKLFYLPPATLSYSVTQDIYTKDRPITSNRPVIIGTCNSFTIAPSITNTGLTFDAVQGTIAGSPRIEQSETQYTVSCRSGSDTLSTKVIFGFKDFTLPTNLVAINSQDNKPIAALLTLYPGEKRTIKLNATGVITAYSIVGTLPSHFTFDSGSGTISAYCVAPFVNHAINYRISNSAGYSSSLFNVTCSQSCQPNFENINITFPYGGSVKKAAIRLRVLSSTGDILISMDADNLVNGQSYIACAPISQTFSIRGTSVSSSPIDIYIQSRTSILQRIHTLPSLGGSSTVIYYDYQFAVTAPDINYGGNSFTFIIPTEVDLVPIKPNVISNCVVSPQLPLGLTIDPYSCKISGTPYESKTASSYAITATNAAGSQPPQSISIVINDCADTNRIFFVIDYFTGDNPSDIKFSFSDSQGTTNYLSVEYDITKHSPNKNVKYVGCMPEQSSARIRMESSIPWATAYLKIDIAGKNFGTYKKTSTSSAENQLINIDILISPIRKWKLATKYTGTKQWYQEKYDDLTWTENAQGDTGSSFLEDINVCYLVTKIPSKAIDSEVPAYKVSLTHVSGLLLYINGIEYYRRFLPAVITNSTYATGAFNFPSPVTLILPISSLVSGQDNTISLAIYRRQIDSNPTFRISLYGTLLDRTLTCLTHKNLELVSQSGNFRPDEDASKVIDGSLSTDWTELLSLIPGSTATATFKFPDNYYVWVNNYGFYSSRHARENANNNPLTMEFRGYSTQSLSWLTLGDKTATETISIGGNNQELSYYHFSDTTLFNQLRVIITATVGTESDVNFAELLFSTCHVYYCKEDQGFAGAPQDSIATAECPKGFLGDRTRECGIGKNPLWGEINESNCNVGPPVDFNYPSKSYIFNTFVEVRKTETTPNYTSILPVTFQAQTPLPSGLSVDSTRGYIYGIPLTRTTPRDYTINVKNSNNEFISTKVQITIERRSCPIDGDWPGTEGGEFSEILCPAGQTGTRKRLCVDGEEPYWGDKDESLCRDDVTKGTKVPLAVIIVGSILAFIGVMVIIICVWIKCKHRKSSGKRADGSTKLTTNARTKAVAAKAPSTDGRSIRPGTAEKKSARSVRL